jgi:hypothetical protein
MGEDGSPENKPLNKPYQKVDPKTGQPMQDDSGNPIVAMHDLSAGKYDLTVTSGPSFTTRREEAAFQMTEMMRALPASAPILGKHLAKNLDWPGADEIAEELEQMGQPQIPPDLQQAIEEGKQQIAQLTEENQKLKQDHSLDAAELQMKQQIAQQEADAEFAIAQIKIASEERIAMMKVQADARVNAEKARLNAQVAANKPQPQTQAA